MRDKITKLYVCAVYSYDYIIINLLSNLIIIEKGEAYISYPN